MPRKPADKVQADQHVERLISMPGWVYNLFIERATRERRPVKYQIELELERLAEQHAQQAAPAEQH
jgi:hypothetical protein